MQQVGKYFILFLFFVSFLFFATGCSYKKTAPVTYTKIYDQNITKVKLLNTIKQYFKHKDDRYIIEAYQDSVYIFKPTIGMDILQADLIQYNYEVNLSKNQDNTLTANLQISKQVGYDSQRLYLDQNNSFYKKFWEDIDKRLQ